MRHAALLLFLLLGGAGCFRPFDLADEARRDTRDRRPAPAPAPAPITADQVTPQNAHRMSQALLDEMDRESLRSAPK